MSAFELLASGFQSVEGPTVDAAGDLYFCDVFAGGVFRLATDGTCTEILARRRYIGGLCPHADGGLVVSGRDVAHLRDGELTTLLDRDALPGGDPSTVAGFGDLCADPAGRLLVGAIRKDPARETLPGELVLVEKAGTAVEVYGGIGLSNGLAVTADGTTLFHADTDAREIHVSRLQPDGPPVRERTFSTATLDGRPDGMAADAEGGVWVALLEGGRVVRFDDAGTVTERLDVPAGSPLSVCFAGEGLVDLVVTTMDNRDDPHLGASIFRTSVGVRGAPVHPVHV